MQKLFIRSAMGLFEARTGNVEDPVDEEGTNAVVDSTALSEQSTVNGAEEPSALDRNLDEDDNYVSPSDELAEPEELEEHPAFTEQVDADLETLENIGQQPEEVPEGEEQIFDIDTVIPTGVGT